MQFTRAHRKLAATAIIAVGVPVGANAYVGSRTRDVAAHLGAAAGVTARIGGVDADLTGRIRLSDVALGDMFAADSIEASVALDSLLSGQLGADEIRVAGPRVAIAVDRNGDSDLARLVRKLAKASAAGSGAAGSGANTPARLRRIVVSSGSLVAHVDGIGELAADNVELVPDANGVRVITGPLHVHGSVGALRGDFVLARSAAELALPHVKFGRVLAVAGTGEVVIGDRTISLRDVAIGRLARTVGEPGTGERGYGALELRASLDDGGLARSIDAQVAIGRDLEITVRGDRVPLRAFAALAPHGLGLTDARASGQLVATRRGDALQLAVDGTLDGVRLDHPTIGAQPIAVSLGLHGAVTLAPDALSIEHFAVDLAGRGSAAGEASAAGEHGPVAHWTASGWWRRGQPLAAQLDVALQPAACNDQLAALPVELRGPLDGMTMTGTFGGRARVAIDLGAPAGDGVVFETDFDNRCVVQIEPPAADATQLSGPGEMIFADGTHAQVGKGTAAWTPLHRMPGFVPAAFVSAEDARFFYHHGFDTAQIAKSFEIDLRDHRLARGGSTISQQLVKNTFLTQRRSVDRKIQEAILTWRLEARLDKKTILERYLNVIELGPHMFGIRAAATYWFGESPHELTLKQAAFLAALTSEPRSMNRRIRRAQGLDADSAGRVDVILRAMTRDGAIDMAEYQRAAETPLFFAQTALRAEN